MTPETCFECRICGKQEQSHLQLQKHLQEDHEPFERREFLIMEDQPREDTYK
jgi:hypothetical protein